MPTHGSKRTYATKSFSALCQELLASEVGERWTELYEALELSLRTDAVARENERLNRVAETPEDEFDRMWAATTNLQDVQ
tara:strand:- start:30 stop:269 length:240 start_codon:yes stop_codon:yes gene_type:complete